MKQIVPSFCSSSLFISLLLAIILCSSPTQSIGQDVLNDICSKTADPSFCLQTLKSDPQTVTTDLLGLAGISIKLPKPLSVKLTHLLSHNLLRQLTPNSKRSTHNAMTPMMMPLVMLTMQMKG